MAEIDFGDGVRETPGNGGNAGGSGGASQEEVTHLNGDGTTTDLDKDGNTAGDGSGDGAGKGGNQGGGDGNGDGNENSSTGGLEAGTIISFDGNDYTVAENGDVVDKDGNVFKKAEEVDAWLKENEVEDSNSEPVEIPVNDLIAEIGIEVKDENGKDVEFTNDSKGLASYINSILELKSTEVTQATMNKFYQDNPIVKQFVDYLTVNNGNPRGFGEIPDRTKVVLDKENQTQQEQIIRMAAQEFGNKSLNDSYIKYLKDSGGLYEEAVNQLQALIDKDNEAKARIEKQAKAQRDANDAAVAQYLKNVNDVITSRKIAGYKIPESFVKEVNGQKITLTPADFYDYVCKANQVDANGNKVTGYQKDFDSLSEEELLNKDMLDAWLMFTGGTYKDLINMAVKEQEVRKLVIKSNERRNARTIKISKQTGKVNSDDILLS